MVGLPPRQCAEHRTRALRPPAVHGAREATRAIPCSLSHQPYQSQRPERGRRRRHARLARLEPHTPLRQAPDEQKDADQDDRQGNHQSHGPQPAS